MTAPFVSPLAYRPSSVATRHSSSGKPFGSALAAPSVHRQVDEIRGNRLLLRHHVSVGCLALRASLLTLGNAQTRLALLSLNRRLQLRPVFGFRPLPSRLGIAQASLALHSALRRVDSCRKCRNKGFDNMPNVGYVKAFFLCVFKQKFKLMFYL